MSDDVLHIAYTTDAGYLLQTEVAASSAVALASDRAKIVIHVFDSGVSDENWGLFERRMRKNFGDAFGLKRHLIDTTPYRHLRDWRGSYASYVRIETADLIPESDWALFADGDTLFLTDPLKLNALRDPTASMIGQDDCFGANQPIWWKNHGFDWSSQVHVCVGFALKNIKWMRENKIRERCLEILEAHPDIPNVEQDTLNMTCASGLKFLPPEWGCYDFAATSRVLNGAIHYVAVKPWNGLPKEKVPMTSPTRVWLLALRLFCGVTPWEHIHITRSRYVYLSAKSYIVSAVYKIINVLPGIRGQYNKSLGTCWGLAALHRVKRAYKDSLNHGN